MQATTVYHSPLGPILLAADDEGLTGLWFEGQEYYARGLDPQAEPIRTPMHDEACQWLDAYFAGRRPEALPPLHLTGTAFQKSVWELLLQIPYGCTTTYGELASRLSGGGRSFSQAVGHAVGHNPVSVLVPCHRVVGAGGSLTGYAGGIDRKIALLTLEGVDLSRLHPPRKTSAR